MDSVVVAVFGLCILAGFCIWFTVLTGRINRFIDEADAADERLEEIQEGLKIVAHILNNLNEVMPNFTINQNPFQGIFDAFAQKITGEGLLTYDTPARNADGQFNGEKETEIKWKTQG